VTEIKNTNSYFLDEILMAVTMKTAVFWVEMVSGLEAAQHFGGAYCLHLNGQ
jgi:hypothetical protein